MVSRFPVVCLSLIFHACSRHYRDCSRTLHKVPPPPVKEPLFSSAPLLGSGCRDHPKLKQAVFVRSKPLCSPQPDYARRGKQTVAAAAAAAPSSSDSCIQQLSLIDFSLCLLHSWLLKMEWDAFRTQSVGFSLRDCGGCWKT